MNKKMQQALSFIFEYLAATRLADSQKRKQLLFAISIGIDGHPPTSAFKQGA